MQATPKRRRGRPADEALRERRRQEILDKAAAIFAQNGYQHTDVQLVADALPVGKGTIYRYFPSKEALFLAVVDRGIQRMREAVTAVTTGIDDPLEVVARAIRAYLAFYRDHPEFAELIIQERAQFKDRKTHSYFAQREARAQVWQELYRGLIKQGRVRPIPVERITDVIGDLVYGTMFTNYFSGRHKSLDEQARDILDIVFHGILTDEERQRRHGEKGVAN